MVGFSQPLENLQTNKINFFNMRKFPVFIIILLALSVYSCQPSSESIYFKFSNTTDLPRVSEVIQISYNDYKALCGEIPSGQLPVFIHGIDTLISQNIDQNKDGIPEDILVEISLDPKSSRDVQIIYTETANFPVFPPKTNLHFAFKDSPTREIDTVSRVQTTDTEMTQKVFQLEGPVWENDKVGFRNYFDLRNGMDIFGKRVSGMVLDTIGLGGNYHILNPWGMDVLKVGNSLGAGSIALDIVGKLYRVGDNGHGKFERVYEGPLKSEFRFDFPDWKVGEQIIDLTQYISITSGVYAFESDVFINRSITSFKLIAGIVNKLSNALYHEQVSPGHMLIATYDKQAEDSSYMGMALLIPYSQFIEYAEAPKTGDGITETYFARIKLVPGEPSKFYFYAGWELSNPEFSEMSSFITMIKRDAIKIENPVQVSRTYPLSNQMSAK